MRRNETPSSRGSVISRSREAISPVEGTVLEGTRPAAYTSASAITGSSMSSPCTISGAFVESDSKRGATAASPIEMLRFASCGVVAVVRELRRVDGARAAARIPTRRGALVRTTRAPVRRTQGARGHRPSNLQPGSAQRTTSGRGEAAVAVRPSPREKFTCCPQQSMRPSVCTA